jgi:hypothetical protein
MAAVRPPRAAGPTSSRTLGVGIAVGTLIAYFTVAVAVGIVYGIMLAIGD